MLIPDVCRACVDVDACDVEVVEVVEVGRWTSVAAVTALFSGPFPPVGGEKIQKSSRAPSI